MKIGVIGCGALGSYYGARLCRCGHAVHFLLRSDYDVVRRDGVRVRSPEDDFSVRPHCAWLPEEIGSCDLVLIGLKTTANEQLARLLPPLLGPDTAVLTLQNGLGPEAAAAAVCGADRVLGGLCFVCLNRTAPGVIHHIAFGKIVLGEYQRPASPRAAAFAEAIRASGVPCEVTSNLECARWQKLVWNVPFNGLGVAGVAGHDAVLRGAVGDAPRGACLATDRLLGEPRWEALVRELMLEIIHAAHALGHAVPESEAERQITRTRAMGTYRASTLIDYERGQPLELESIFGEPLRQARAAGAAVPRLAALYAVLKELDARSNPRLTGHGSEE